MDKQSTLYQLMGMRMNGIMNGITEQDGDYQALLRAVILLKPASVSCIFFSYTALSDGLFIHFFKRGHKSPHGQPQGYQGVLAPCPTSSIP